MVSQAMEQSRSVIHPTGLMVLVNRLISAIFL